MDVPIGIHTFFFLSEDGVLLHLMLRGVLCTTLAVFGIIANSLSITIFLRSGNKSSFNLTLIGKVAKMCYKYFML